MTTADDHWPATLERVVLALDFAVAPNGGAKPEVCAVVREDIGQLPALVSMAVLAALELDRRVGAGEREPPIDRKAILTRRDLTRAVVATANGGTHGAFVPGYATAYRVQLARILWNAIADAPRRRLEELARPRLKSRDADPIDLPVEEPKKS